MNVYITTFFLFLIFMIFDDHICLSSNSAVISGVRNKKNSSIFLIAFEAVWLIAITGLRHSSLSPDYYNYKYSYISSKGVSVLEILKTREQLYHLISKIIGIFSGYDVIVLMIALAIITVVPIIIYFKKEIPQNVLFAIFVILTLGSYYTSFNTTRQYMCIGLFSLSLFYVYNKKFTRYVISILLISLIHSSALILIPFYWLLYIKWNNRKSLLINFAMILSLGVLFFILPRLAYGLLGLYYGGMNSLIFTDLFDKTQEELSLFVIMRPLLFFVIALLNKKLIDQNDRRDLCLFNCSFYFLLFTAYAYQITMFRRFSYFFIPGTIVLTIGLINKENCKYSALYKTVIVLFALVWSIFGQFDNEYLFFWE